MKSNFIEGSFNKKYYMLCYSTRCDPPFYTFTENDKLICALAEADDILVAIENIASGKGHPPSRETREMSRKIGIELAYS